MATNPYKAFIPYIHNQSVLTLIENRDITDIGALGAYEHRDPVGGQWRNSGLAQVQDGQYAIALGSGSNALLMHVQFNERILPSKVRDEKVNQRVAVIAEQQGRKVSKKQYAEVRDEVEAELLPIAFIRRSVVPVIFNDRWMFVCTSSQMKSDSVVSILFAALENVCEGFEVRRVMPKGHLITKLTGILKDDQSGTYSFQVGNYAVLKGEGEDKKTVKVKELNLASSEVKTLLDKGYEVHDIALELFSEKSDEILIDFKLNEKFVFRSCLIPNIHLETVKREDKDAELLSFTWLIATTFRNVLEDILEYTGDDLSDFEKFDGAEANVEADFDSEEEEEL